MAEEFGVEYGEKDLEEAEEQLEDLEDDAAMESMEKQQDW